MEFYSSDYGVEEKRGRKGNEEERYREEKKKKRERERERDRKSVV